MGQMDSIDDQLLEIDAMLRHLSRDAYFYDIPKDLATDELADEISLKLGMAFEISVVRFDGDVYKVIVNEDANVRDLKLSLQRVVMRRLAEQGISRVNWRHVWRKYYLLFDGKKLTDDLALLKDIGITDGSKLKFIIRLRR